MDALRNYGPVIGRILLALVFLLSGFGKIAGFEGTAGFIASKGLPLPEVGAAIAIVVEIVAAVLLIIGWKVCWAAGALFIYTAATAILFHNFWAMPPEQAQMQMIGFLKNLSIMGGLLYAVVYGSGPIAVESKQE